MSFSFTVQVLAQLDLLRNFAFLHSVTDHTQITSKSRGARVVDVLVEIQPFYTNSSHFELVPGRLRILKKFLGTVSSWTKQV